jgi:heat shock protein 4
MKKEKPRIRLLEAIEKCRKVLSANNEAGISLEYLMEEDDLNDNVTRE